MYLKINRDFFVVLYLINVVGLTLLLELVLYGVGYHHAGMDIADRKRIETMFTEGDLPVLCKSTCL